MKIFIFDYKFFLCLLFQFIFSKLKENYYKRKNYQTIYKYRKFQCLSTMIDCDRMR